MFESLRQQVKLARQHGDLYFAALLSREDIRKAFGSASSTERSSIYTHAVTIWIFLSQCLSPDHSCRDAVSRLAAWLVGQKRKPCSTETGGYCIARDALPEELCRELARHTGQDLDAQVSGSWLWRGRRVCVVDGSTVTMPDTAENQAEYPQQQGQKPGCGFPIARVLVIFSLSVGAVLEAAIGKYQGKLTGENSMLRSLYATFRTEDVVLADRCFSGWFDLALLQQQGVDFVARKHQARTTDFRRGRRLGHDDHLICWDKPPRPDWMSTEVYAGLPDRLVVREVRVRVTQRGFRTKTVLVITSLLEPAAFPANALAELYRRRWQAELNLRSLKMVLQMDHLRCKKPHRVRNEFYMHLLAYNLLRRVMALAALENGVLPWHISFKGTLQTLSNFLPLLVASMSLNAGCQALLEGIATHKVGHRPNRLEPRRVKRRPKQYKLLQEPRDNYKRRMK